MSQFFDFAVTTIFAREVLEGSIIIGEYRTIIMRGETLPENVTKKQALKEVTVAALVASVFAVLVCAAVAIPLAVLSRDFNDKTSKVIEGISKIVAAICILQLSLKFPKWLGVYKSKKKNHNHEKDLLSLRSIRFNVAWNIWREVAECGVFLLPFFLSGEGIQAIPLSAVLGTVVGLVIGVGLYYANKKLTNKLWLAIFTALLLVFMSAGLFTGGCHNLEKVFGKTPTVWTLNGDFWSIDRLPMTIFKPFGYSDSRTVLQIVCFWSWLLLAGLLHFRKYLMSLESKDEAEIKQSGWEMSEHDSQNSNPTASTDASSGVPPKESVLQEDVSGTDDTETEKGTLEDNQVGDFNNVL